jgi:hypothetical protein
LNAAGPPIVRELREFFLGVCSPVRNGIYVRVVRALHSAAHIGSLTAQIENGGHF